ncbi:hypothetical protein F5Y10DRAFT_257626 [Nemania abortiva]|nr:hypothetical protein F5Y10DRAFT_257626 [Nemania abortiva]
MSDTAIHAGLRVAGWNVEFTRGPDESSVAFAGIYQVRGNRLVTFRDVCDDLRLCFEISNDAADGGGGDNNSDPWAGIAFYLTSEYCEPPDARPYWPSFVTQELGLDMPVPCLSPWKHQEQGAVRYHVVFHTPCDLPSHSRLDAHLQARCARHLPDIVTRCDPRYLPPPDNATLTSMPFSPGTTSELEIMLGRAGMEVDAEGAREHMNDFRSRCITMANCCAVSGEGATWGPNPIAGPALEACHIIPQQHYHLYPSSTSDQQSDNDETVEESARRLLDAWERTWSLNNGILLKGDLRACFDARLFSIHPSTLLVRVFVPYDFLINFNGRKALVPKLVNKTALRHHYEMCCIENMAALTLSFAFMRSRTCKIEAGQDSRGRKRRRSEDDRVIQSSPEDI